MFRLNKDATVEQIRQLDTYVRMGALVPVTEPLLTREEAANDPEVQEMIARFILKASGWDDR